jgi:phytanoyl-CoA hydroxylase
MIDLIKAKGWRCTAPAVQAGDVILWDARTIHGSLPTATPEFSRSSFTSHFSTAAGRFVNARARRTQINGVAVQFPKPRIAGVLKRLLLARR